MTNEEFLELDNELEQYIGTLCLTSVSYGILLYKGMYDTEEDYYYHFLSMKKDIAISLCACNIIWLWDELKADSYNSLVRSWNLNNTVQARYNRIVNINMNDFTNTITEN